MRTRFGAAAAVGLLVVIGIGNSTPSVSAQSGRGKGTTTTGLPPGQNREVLHVKFREGTRVRLRGNSLVSLGGDNVAGLDAVLARFPGTRVERLFSRPEAALDADRTRVQGKSTRKQADLNLWYRFRLRPSADAVAFISALKTLSIVEHAYAEPLPAPPPIHVDFTAQQTYRNAAGDGIDAIYANAIPGGTGANVRIIDVEYSWNLSHEDLTGITAIANGTPTDPFSNNDHGTAVLGEFGSDNNAGGVTGIAHAADLAVVNASDNGSYDLADAISIAHSNLVAGDVMIIEQQTAGANGGCDAGGQTGCVAVEWVQAFYDAIVAATGDGIIVLEAAGNGNQDLDGNEYGATNFPSDRAHSGAIIVGAGSAPSCTAPLHDRLDFSTYGGRVDLQGYGECVVTTGYGTLQGASMSNDAYSNTFGGTSSATPIVTGAAAVLSSVAQQQGVTWTPQQIRDRLVATATPQSTDATALGGHIGPLPNLREALKAFVPDSNPGGPYSTPEGTDVALSGTASTDPQGGAVTYAWDLDNDGQFDDSASATPTFSSVGQDGVFTVRLRVTDAHGAFDDDSTTVTVTNVAPTTTVNAITGAVENTGIAVTGSVTDPGWLDPLTASVDWGDGTTSAATGATENVRPDASLAYSSSHTYGDDGTFTVKVCGADDDTSHCASRSVTITNGLPTAVIDLSTTINVNGTPVVIAQEGVPTAFKADSTDPGSDDLTAVWDWADPTPDTSTVYLNNAAFNPDPDPSPTINPRAITDNPSHTFGSACAYLVTFRSTDDDSGSASDDVQVIVTGNAGQRFGAGYWQTQYRPRPTALSEARRLCYLSITGVMSAVFHETRDASTLANAFDVFFVGGNKGSAAQQLDRQLLTAWMNFANGGFTLTTLVDTDGVGGADTAFGTVIATAEAVRNNLASTAGQLRAQKAILERING